MLTLLVKVLIVLKQDVDTAYVNKTDFNKVIYNYFINDKCLRNAICKEGYIKYKNKKIIIKKYKSKSVIRSKINGYFEEIIKKFKKEDLSISK